MRYGRQYSVTKQRSIPEIRLGSWSLRAPSIVVEEMVDDESMNVLADISPDELLEVLKTTEDPERLRRAIWTCPKIGKEEHYQVIEERLKDEFYKRAGQEEKNSPVWPSAAVEVLAEYGGSEQRRSLLRLAQGSQPLSRLAALSLAREGQEGVQAALKRMVSSPSADDVFAQLRAASSLYTVFGDWSGLDELKEGLWSSEEERFSRGLGAFTMVPAEQRGPEVLGMLVEALRQQQDPHHLVTLMNLVDGVNDPEGEIAPVLTSYLPDRRRARETFADGRAGRVRDFAAFYLARYLRRTREAGGLEAWSFPRSFLGRRRLRKQVIQALASDPETA